MPTPIVIVNDTFTDTNGTALTAHTGEIGATWTLHPTTPTATWEIQTNRARNTTVAGAILASGTPHFPDYDVEAEFFLFADVSTAFGIIGRCDPTVMTAYSFRHSQIVGQWELYKLVAGTGTLLDTVALDSISPGTTVTMKLEMRGSDIRAYVDDVEVCGAVDSAITATGRAGFRTTSATSSKLFASFTVTEYVLAGSYITSGVEGTDEDAPIVVLT
jgi:hypothetical protein